MTVIMEEKELGEGGIQKNIRELGEGGKGEGAGQNRKEAWCQNK